MRIAIVEDQTEYQNQLQDYLEKYQEEFQCQLEVQCFENGMGFVHTFKSQFDIILMDVAMPYLDGFETARRIRKTDSEVVILFVTNQAQHAIRGYEVDAMDYILKPISYFAFSQRLKRAVSRVSHKEKPCLMISYQSAPKKLRIDSIRYLESKGHNVVYHTTEGDFKVFGGLKDVEQKLEAHHFLRCNKGYLVSLRYVDDVNDGFVHIGNDRLLISRPRKAAFMQALTDYMGGNAV